VHAILQEMQGDGQTFQTEFVGETELAKAEEVFAEVFGEIAANELLGAVVESTGTVGACVIAESGTLEEMLAKQRWMRGGEEGDLRRDRPDETSFARA
jgi:hypothetical protein